MKFRKIPVVIDAWQWDGETPSHERPDWLRGSDVLMDGIKNTLLIDTLEGTMTAQPSDWIVKGVKGEIYPVKPDIFAATYEPYELDPNIVTPASDHPGPFPQEE